MKHDKDHQASTIVAAIKGGYYAYRRKAGVLREKGISMYRVIVADDESKFRNWLSSLLNVSDDFQIVGNASNGTEAISLVASLLPDLVIADIYMPEMDGFEVAQYIQRHFPSVNVILVSVHDEHIYERLAREKGAIAFIPKARLSLDALCLALRGEK